MDIIVYADDLVLTSIKYRRIWGMFLEELVAERKMLCSKLNQLNVKIMSYRRIYISRSKKNIIFELMANIENKRKKIKECIMTTKRV